MDNRNVIIDFINLSFKFQKDQTQLMSDLKLLNDTIADFLPELNEDDINEILSQTRNLEEALNYLFDEEITLNKKNYQYIELFYNELFKNSDFSIETEESLEDITNAIEETEKLLKEREEIVEDDTEVEEEPTETDLLLEEIAQQEEEEYLALYESEKEEIDGYSDSMMQTILNNSRKYPLLDYEETEKLLKEYGEYGDEQILNKLVMHNQRLVISIAKRHLGKGLAFEELFQEGCLGLTKAIQRFDVSKGTKLSTYATWWIKQSIGRAIADQGKTVRIPVHMNEKLNKYYNQKRQLTLKLGREPSLQELAKELKLSIRTISDYEQYSMESVSINTKVGKGDGDDTELLDFIGDDYATNAYQETINQTSYNAFREALKNAGLKEREYLVLYYRFGLDGHPGGRTLEEVGQMFQVTRERIRQIEAKGLRKLRSPRNLRIFSTLMDNPDKAYEEAVKLRKKGLYDPQNAEIKNLTETLKIKLPELKHLVSLIPIESQEYLKTIFDDDFNVKIQIQDKFVKTINERLLEIKREIKQERAKYRNEQLSITIKKELNVLLKISAQELREKLSLLTSDEIELIYEFYDQDFRPLPDKKIDSKTNNKLSKIKNKIKKTLYDPELELGIKNLPKSLNMSIEEFQIYLAQIPEKQQKLITNYYDEKYIKKRNIIFDKDDINEIIEIKKSFSTKLQKQLESHNDPKYKPLYKILGINITKLQNIISMLSEDEQKIIFLFYDNAFYPRINLRKNKELQKNFNDIINSIKNIVANERKQKLLEEKAYYKTLGLTKEEFLNIYAKLTPKTQEFIKKFYDDNFLPNNNKKTPSDHTRFSLIKKKIFELKENPNLAYKGKPFKNLAESMNITKKELIIIITKLSNEEKELINKIFDDNFDARKGIKLTDEEKNSLTKIKKKITYFINNPNHQTILNPNNLYLSLNITKENLENIIKMLSISDKNKIKLYYDENYNPKVTNTRNDYQTIYKLKKKIAAIVENPEAIKEINKDNLVISLDITLEKLLELIKLLPNGYQEFIKINYDEDFNLIPKSNRSGNDFKKIHKIVIALEELKQNPNKTINQRNKTLYDSLKITIEQLEEIIKLLPLNDQKLIKHYYDESYNIKQFSKVTYDYVTMSNIRKKIQSIIDDPANIKNINKSNIYIALEMEKEKVIELIALLNEEQKTYIKEHYDENLNLKLNVNRERSDYLLITKIKEEIIALYEIQKAEKEKSKAENNKPFYEFLNINFETFKFIFKNIASNEKELLIKYYNSNFTKNDIPFTEEDKHTIFNNLIPRYLYLIQDIAIAPLNNSQFNPAELSILESLNDIEKAIILMKSKYPSDYIANTLKIDIRLVRNVTRYFLTKVKEELNKQYDTAIDNIVHDKHLLQLKKEEEIN